MKNILLVAIAFAGSFAYGSYTVCSSPTLYYSFVQKDFGIDPPNGVELGSKTIVSRGKVLHHEIMIKGAGGFTIPNFEVTLSGPVEVLKQTGNQVSGSTVFRQIAVLSSVTPGNLKEVERASVVCEKTWAMVP